VAGIQYLQTVHSSRVQQPPTDYLVFAEFPGHEIEEHDAGRRAGLQSTWAQVARGN
ncbi:hypothetical protein PtrEW4_011030, partial [Pyrenophora tritici-repentis]